MSASHQLCHSAQAALQAMLLPERHGSRITRYLCCKPTGLPAILGSRFKTTVFEASWNEGLAEVQFRGRRRPENTKGAMEVATFSLATVQDTTTVSRWRQHMTKTRTSTTTRRIHQEGNCHHGDKQRESSASTRRFRPRHPLPGPGVGPHLVPRTPWQWRSNRRTTFQRFSRCPAVDPRTCTTTCLGLLLANSWCDLSCKPSVCSYQVLFRKIC